MFLIPLGKYQEEQLWKQMVWVGLLFWEIEKLSSKVTVPTCSLTSNE